MKIHRRQIFRSSLSLTALSLLGTGAKAEPTTTNLPPKPPLEAYVKSPLISHISISPDAQKIALVTNQGDEQFLKQFDRSSPQIYNASLGNKKIRNLFWGDNDHVVVVSSNTETLPQFGGFKHEISQALIINPKTGKSKRLFDNNPKLFYPIAFGARRITTSEGYRVLARNYIFNDDPNLQLDIPSYQTCVEAFSTDVDTVSKKSDLVQRLSSGATPCIASETGRVITTSDGHILAAEREQTDHNFTVVFNMAARGKHVFAKEVFRRQYKVESPELIGLGSDDQSVIIYIPDEDKGGDYYQLSRDGKLSAPLDTQGRNQDRAALFDPNSEQFVGFAYFDDSITYKYTNPLLDKLATSLPKVMGEDYRSEIIEFAQDPRQMIVRIEGADDAGSYYFVDFSTGATTLLATNYAQIPTQWLSQKKPIKYTAKDGLKIPAYLTLPPNRVAKNLPLIVMPHGGPQARDTIDFDGQAQALASRGYCVLQPNYRGSSGYGFDFLQAGYGEFGRKMQTDLSDGVRHLVAQGLVDPKRVAIVGASYGGYTALAGACIDIDVYNCAISIAGPADLRYMLKMVKDKSGENEYTASVLYWKRYFGSDNRLDEVSPIANVSKANIPILLVHGKDDSVVDYEHSVRMNNALKSAGKDVEFLSFEHQDHWESIESMRIDMIKRIAAFLDKHNPA